MGLPDGCDPGVRGREQHRPRGSGVCQGPARPLVGAASLSTLGGPLLAARDSICSYPQISQRLMPPQVALQGVHGE